ncbi:MAG: GNAT family N-acyltransferase [Anaeromyxobacteraceae bacterium]
MCSDLRHDRTCTPAVAAPRRHFALPGPFDPGLYLWDLLTSGALGTPRGPESRGRLGRREGTPVYALRSVETAQELRACRRVRYSVYCVRKGWLSTEQDRAEEEVDEHDAASEHFLAADGAGEIVGTVRLILSSRAREPLPISHHPALRGRHLPMANSGEISRLCVSAAARNFNVELGLYRLIYDRCKALGLDHCYIVVDATFLDLLNRLGFGFIPLGEPTYYWGGYTVPARCDPAVVDSQLRATNRGLYEWLQEPPSSLEGTRLLQRFVVPQRARSRPRLGVHLACPPTTSSSSATPAMFPPTSSGGSAAHPS